MLQYPSTCDIYRPFDGRDAAATGIPCRLIPALNVDPHDARNLTWTHYIDVPADTDVRDGCTRAAGDSNIAFNDGDEVRVGSTRYVVVWVEPHDRDGLMAFRRAYLLRHEVAWPDL